MKKFFKQVAKGERVETLLTKQIFKTKRLIIAHTDTLNAEIARILAKTKVLIDLAKHKIQRVPEIVYIDTLVDADHYYMHCPKCKHNCHDNCTAWYKGACKIMDWSGNCTQCKLGCKKGDHKLEKKRWKFEVQYDLKQTIDAVNKVADMNDLELELIEMECQLYGRIGSIIIFNDEFNEYALKPNEYTIERYIDELIANENNNARNEGVIYFLKCLKKENVIKAIKNYSNKLKNEGVIFANLNQKELGKHFEKIREAVREEVRKTTNHQWMYK